VSYEPKNGRDVIFVPVGLNYDQTLEDRFLINAGKAGNRRFRPSAWSVIRSCAIYAWWRVTGKFRGFGSAAVGFGTPLELSTIPDGEGRTEAVAAELMERIKAVVPVLSVPLVARALMVQPDTNRAALIGTISVMLDQLRHKGIPLPRREIGAMVDETLKRFTMRKLVVVSGQHVTVKDDQVDVIAYYASTISHHFPQ